MTKRSQQILAIFLILLGVLYIIANFFENIDPGDLFWPVVLIVLGAVLIFRPRFIAPENAELYFARDISLSKEWTPGDKEVRMFAGDIDIDLRRMDLNPGENHYWVKFFAGDITIDVPEDVGLKINSTAFVVEVKLDGETTSNVMTGYQYTSDNFETVDKQFILHTSSFAVDLKIRSS